MTSADTLAWTPPSLDDTASVAGLLNRIDEAEGFGEPIEEPSAREWLSMPGRDLSRDAFAAWDGEQLIGFGLVDVTSALDREGRARCSLIGGVDPAHRGRGIGTRLFELLERRAAQLAAERHPGAPAFYRAGGGADPRPVAADGAQRPGGIDVRPVLDRRGYRRVRSWLEMVRDLPGEPLQLPASEGFSVLAPADGDREATRLAHIAAFADHWGSTPPDSERWSVWWSSHTARRELSTIAKGAEGTVLGYAIASEEKPRVLHIGLVGTRPAARGRGVARAVIARTLEAAAQAGYERVELEVDSESLTGATRLYDALGFERHRVFATYEKPVALPQP